ncbi:hypothetical protein ACWGQ2_13060 [Arthrobacter sp. NPDC055585]
MTIILGRDMRVRCKPISFSEPLEFLKFGFDGFLLALQPRLGGV